MEITIILYYSENNIIMGNVGCQKLQLSVFLQLIYPHWTRRIGLSG